MYIELSQSRWLTDCAKNKKFVKFTSDALCELQKRYEGPVALQPPVTIKKKKHKNDQYSDNEEEEKQDKQRKNNTKYKLGKWKFSL